MLAFCSFTRAGRTPLQRHISDVRPCAAIIVSALILCAYYTFCAAQGKRHKTCLMAGTPLAGLGQYG